MLRSIVHSADWDFFTWWQHNNMPLLYSVHALVQITSPLSFGNVLLPVCEWKFVCVCVCDRERERERQSVSVFMCVGERGESKAVEVWLWAFSPVCCSTPLVVGGWCGPGGVTMALSEEVTAPLLSGLVQLFSPPAKEGRKPLSPINLPPVSFFFLIAVFCVCFSLSCVCVCVLCGVMRDGQERQAALRLKLELCSHC